MPLLIWNVRPSPRKVLEKSSKQPLELPCKLKRGRGPNVTCSKRVIQQQQQQQQLHTQQQQPYFLKINKQQHKILLLQPTTIKYTQNYNNKNHSTFLLQNE